MSQSDLRGGPPRDLYWIGDIEGKHCDRRSAMRKPVGVTTSPNGHPVVVCDDGSVVVYDGNGDWADLKPIPGSASDKNTQTLERPFIELPPKRSETERIVNPRFLAD
jgi:hypothetical protein